MEIIARWYSKKTAGFRGRRWEKTTCFHHEATDSVKTVLILVMSLLNFYLLWDVFVLTYCCWKHTDEGVWTKQSGERCKNAPSERSLFEAASQHLWTWNHWYFFQETLGHFSAVSGNKTKRYFLTTWRCPALRLLTHKRPLFDPASVKPLIIFKETNVQVIFDQYADIRDELKRQRSLFQTTEWFWGAGTLSSCVRDHWLRHETAGYFKGDVSTFFRLVRCNRLNFLSQNTEIWDNWDLQNI